MPCAMPNSGAARLRSWAFLRAMMCVREWVVRMAVDIYLSRGRGWGVCEEVCEKGTSLWQSARMVLAGEEMDARKLERLNVG